MGGARHLGFTNNNSNSNYLRPTTKDHSLNDTGGLSYSDRSITMTMIATSQETSGARSELTPTTRKLYDGGGRGATIPSTRVNHSSEENTASVNNKNSLQFRSPSPFSRSLSPGRRASATTKQIEHNCSTLKVSRDSTRKLSANLDFRNHFSSSASSSSSNEKNKVEEEEEKTSSIVEHLAADLSQEYEREEGEEEEDEEKLLKQYTSTSFQSLHKLSRSPPSYRQLDTECESGRWSKFDEPEEDDELQEEECFGFDDEEADLIPSGDSAASPLVNGHSNYSDSSDAQPSNNNNYQHHQVKKLVAKKSVSLNLDSSTTTTIAINNGMERFYRV